MLKEDKKFKTKEISKQINNARLSFAPSEYMEEYLYIKPGAVSVMGLMNDMENHVRLLIDEDVLQEAYYGCEERLPGEPHMLLITLESEDGAEIRFEAAENWIEMQGLDEGGEWPENLADEDSNDRMAAEQTEWMEGYYRAIQELEG